MSAELTQQELKKLLHYDPETGYFTYKYWYLGNQKGPIAGTRCGNYLHIHIRKKSYTLHRLAFLWMEGELPKEGIDVDHINGDKKDNRYGNLRLCTKSQNCYNRKVASNSNTGIKGLRITEWGTYAARVMSNGVKKTRTFELHEKEEAITWLKLTREALHKEFANHGN